MHIHVCRHVYIYTFTNIWMYTCTFRRYRGKWWKWKGKAAGVWTGGIPVSSLRPSRSALTRRFLSYTCMSDELYRQVSSYEHDAHTCPVVYLCAGRSAMPLRFLSKTYESRTIHTSHKRFAQHKKDAHKLYSNGLLCSLSSISVVCLSDIASCSLSFSSLTLLLTRSHKHV